MGRFVVFEDQTVRASEAAKAANAVLVLVVSAMDALLVGVATGLVGEFGVTNVAVSIKVIKEIALPAEDEAHSRP